MAIKYYNPKIQITPHFNSSEFMCKCGCRQIRIDDRLLTMLETLYSKCNANSITITSGYRCPAYDRKIGGFAGKHSQGMAADIKIKGQDGTFISTKAISCIAEELYAKEGCGIANINSKYEAIHIDSRIGTAYRGNELVSNSSVVPQGQTFYDYYHLTKDDVKKMIGDNTITGIVSKITSLNIRSTPEKTKNIIGKIKKGVSVTIVATKTDSKGIEWGLLKQFEPTKNGWVMMKYVARN